MQKIYPIIFTLCKLLSIIKLLVLKILILQHSVLNIIDYDHIVHSDMKNLEQEL